MKRINFNIKDRKFLVTTLSLVMVCVFTLSIAYAALNTILTIQGNAEVVASTWNIYLDNPRVNVESSYPYNPIVKSSNTVEFSPYLNFPGAFYEFTVDVVNDGSIDAMIANVIKTPELTAEQAKYFKYEVSYANGESITTKQTLSKGTAMPIKVRVEYRNDLNSSDLPTGQVVLDLSLTLEYIQSDGTGSSVKDNGAWTISANGDINEIGTIVTIGSEQFYTIGTEDNNVKLLAVYPLYVGGENRGRWVAYGDEATGMQDVGMRGAVPAVGWDEFGVTPFSSDAQKGTNYSSYNGSIVEGYVNNYKTLLESKFDVSVEKARLLSEDDLINTFGCSFDNQTCSGTEYVWLYNKTIWTGVSYDAESIYYLFVRGELQPLSYSSTSDAGVRPVIVISKDYFN